MILLTRLSSLGVSAADSPRDTRLGPRDSLMTCSFAWREFLSVIRPPFRTALLSVEILSLSFITLEKGTVQSELGILLTQ